MGFRDLRQTVEALREKGRLLEISDPVATLYEAAAVLSEATKRGGQAVYLSRIQGHTVPVAANIVYGREVLAWAMGVADGEVPEELGRRLSTAIPSRIVEEAPVLEVSAAERVPVTEVLPILKHYVEDSAPYITTGLLSAVDPISGETGRGIHRMELRGARDLGVALVNPPLSEIYACHKAKGEPMPLAVSLGVDPLTFAAFALKGSAVTEKLAVAGGLRGEPVEVAAGPLTGILVPARAEFLLEGLVDPMDERLDGPLGEVGGYSLPFPGTPTFRVQRIHHRLNPIYHALLPTGPDGDLLLALVAEAAIGPRVRSLFPFVLQFHYVPGTFGTSLVVRLGKAPREQIRSALLHLVTLASIKKVIAVAEDVDPSDLRAVEWSVATRCQPDLDAMILSDLKGQPIDPSCPERFRTAKLAMDATGYERLRGARTATLDNDALSKARALFVVRQEHG